MIIVPTRICNTDTCRYCGVHKKDFETQYFEDFDMKDFYLKVSFLAQKTNDYTLRFFGGEPFLKFETIKKIVSYFVQNNSEFQFIINTNLTIIDEEKINFIKKHSIKLIISCNGKLKTHALSRGISVEKTLKLYQNIRKITSNNINHQINIVVENESAGLLVENIDFIEKYIGGKNINLLPVNYNGWSKEGLSALKKSFEILTQKMKNKEINIHFINKDFQNEVALFNSEIVIDSDGKVYPSMVILETFFQEEKEKIFLSSLEKKLEFFKKDFEFYDEEQKNIYNQYINKILHKKFDGIIQNDYESSEIFHNFLNTI